MEQKSTVLRRYQWELQDRLVPSDPPEQLVPSDQQEWLDHLDRILVHGYILPHADIVVERALRFQKHAPYDSMWHDLEFILMENIPPTISESIVARHKIFSYSVFFAYETLIFLSLSSSMSYLWFFRNHHSHYCRDSICNCLLGFSPDGQYRKRTLG